MNKKSSHKKHCYFGTKEGAFGTFDVLSESSLVFWFWICMEVFLSIFFVYFKCGKDTTSLLRICLMLVLVKVLGILHVLLLILRVYELLYPRVLEIR